MVVVDVEFFRNDDFCVGFLAETFLLTTGGAGAAVSGFWVVFFVSLVLEDLGATVRRGPFDDDDAASSFCVVVDGCNDFLVATVGV